VNQMKSLTGLSSTGFDGWSWAYQNITGKTITPQQFSQIVAAGGGDHTRNITADEFMGYLQSSGLSGLMTFMPYQPMAVGVLQ
jgi:hypothetical protein